jgi:hypothetical protein
MSSKQFETLRARAALAGISLIESRDERGAPEYVASRWALTKAFASLAGVAAWLDLAAGPERVLAAAGGADE